MLSKRNILIVEDDLLIHMAYKRLLSSDYQITLCDNCNTFYKALNMDTFHLFIIDLALNCEKNGIELIKDLRKDEKYASTPVFVVSAFVLKKDQQHAMDAGATNFLPKPFNNKLLLEEIKKYI